MCQVGRPSLFSCTSYALIFLYDIIPMFLSTCITLNPSPSDQYIWNLVSDQAGELAHKELDQLPHAGILRN